MVSLQISALLLILLVRRCNNAVVDVWKTMSGTSEESIVWDTAGDAVAEATVDIMRRTLLPECPLVITLDSEPYFPRPLVQILMGAASQLRPAVVHVSGEEDRAKWTCSGPGILHNQTEGIERPKVGEKYIFPVCTLFFMSTCTHNFIKLEEFMNGIESSVVVRKALNRFVLWVRDAQEPQSYMFAPPANKYKFKLGLFPRQMRKGQDNPTSPDFSQWYVSIKSVCWFCFGGEPGVFNLPNYIYGLNHGEEKTRLLTQDDDLKGSGFSPEDEKIMWPDTTFNMQGALLRSVYPVPLSSRQCVTNTLDLRRIRHFCFIGEALHFRWELDQFVRPGCPDPCPENVLMIEMNLDVMFRRNPFLPESVITLASFTLTDQTTPFGIDFAGMVTRVPRKILTPDVFVRPFQPVVWGLIAILSTFCASVLTLFVVASSNDLDQDSRHHTFLSSFFYSFGYISESLLEQFPTYVPPQFPPRVFICVWLFISIVLGTAYKTALYDLLTSPPSEILPQTLKELLASNFPVMSERLVKAIIEIYVEDKEIYLPYFERLNATDDLNDCYERCVDEDIICVFRWSTNAPRARSLLDQRGESRLRLTRGVSPMITLAIVLNRDSIFTASFSYWLSNYVASGMKYRWDVMMERNVTMESLRAISTVGLQTGPKIDAFSVGTLAGVFYLLFLGCITSLCVFFFEVQVGRCMICRNRKRTWMEDFERGKTDYIP